jgi:hypothetical protein
MNLSYIGFLECDSLRQRLMDWIDSQTAFLARSPQLHLFVISEMTRNLKLMTGHLIARH